MPANLLKMDFGTFLRAPSWNIWERLILFYHGTFYIGAVI